MPIQSLKIHLGPSPKRVGEHDKNPNTILIKEQQQHILNTTRKEKERKENRMEMALFSCWIDGMERNGWTPQTTLLKSDGQRQPLRIPQKVLYCIISCPALLTRSDKKHLNLITKISMHLQQISETHRGDIVYTFKVPMPSQICLVGFR